MQKRYHNWRRPVESLAENLRGLAFRGSGRLHGFDTPTQTGALELTIGHAGSGIPEVNISAAASAPMGAFITPQGTLIKEDDGIAFTFDTNASNSNIRIDLLVAEHSHVAITGGQDALYSVIKGSTSATEIPAIPNPNIMVALGIVIIPANAPNLNDAIFVPKTAAGEITGEIIMWSGDIENIPAGMALCNGEGRLSNYRPVPDLRGRFIVGLDPEDSDYDAIGDTGPSAPLAGNLQYELVDGGKFIRQGLLTMPNHSHPYAQGAEVDAQSGGGSTNAYIGSNDDIDYDDLGGKIMLHTGDVSTPKIGTSTPATIAPLEAQRNIENRPPWYTLAFLVRL